MTKVKGKVTYNGKAVTGATLTIAPTKSSLNPVSVDVSETGEFEVLAPVGEAKITVDNRAWKNPDKGAIGISGDNSFRDPENPNAPPGGPRPGMPGGINPGGGAGGTAGGQGPRQMPKNDPNMKKHMEESGAPSSFGGGSKVGTYMDIPKKYYDGSSSDLTVTIKKGEPLNIELKD